MALAEWTWIVVHTWCPVSMNCSTWRAASASLISETMPDAGWTRQKCINASRKCLPRSSPEPVVGTRDLHRARNGVLHRVLDGHDIELALRFLHLEREVGGQRRGLAVPRPCRRGRCRP